MTATTRLPPQETAMGRPPVGEPGPELPAGHGRGARRTSKRTAVRLGVGQRPRIDAVCERLAMTRAAFIRRAVQNLIDGRTAPPRSARAVPAAVPSSDLDTLALAAGQEAGLAGMAAVLDDKVLLADPELPRRGGRRGNPDTMRRDALIRYAVETELTKEHQ